jgi:hypothetical protein
MKMGIGIGWPNSTSGSGGVYTFTILDCNSTSITVYSASSQFLPGAFIFVDPELTIPFESNNLWNYPGLIYSLGGYITDKDGEVKAPLTGCPT